MAEQQLTVLVWLSRPLGSRCYVGRTLSEAQARMYEDLKAAWADDGIGRIPIDPARAARLFFTDDNLENHLMTFEAGL